MLQPLNPEEMLSASSCAMRMVGSTAAWRGGQARLAVSRRKELRRCTAPQACTRWRLLCTGPGGTQAASALPVTSVGPGGVLGVVGETLKLQEPRMAMVFTCAVCETRSTKLFHRSSYERGTVIVTCPGCRSHHLVADHLGWFQDDGDGKTIEEILAAKGEQVARVSSVAGLEVLPDDSHSDAPEQSRSNAKGTTESATENGSVAIDDIRNAIDAMGLADAQAVCADLGVAGTGREHADLGALKQALRDHVDAELRHRRREAMEVSVRSATGGGAAPPDGAQPAEVSPGFGVAWDAPKIPPDLSHDIARQCPTGASLAAPPPGAVHFKAAPASTPRGAFDGSSVRLPMEEAIAQMTYTEAEAACEDHGVLVYRPQSGGAPTLLALQAALRAHLEKEGRSR